MSCDKPLFRIGDKVCVLYTSSIISFTITHINLDGTQPLYRGSSTKEVVVGWWSEDRLDYDLSSEQKAAASKLERAMHEANVAVRHARNTLAMAEYVLPGWLIDKIKTADLYNNDIL